MTPVSVSHSPPVHCLQDSPAYVTSDNLDRYAVHQKVMCGQMCQHISLCMCHSTGQLSYFEGLDSGPKRRPLTTFVTAVIWELCCP